MHLLYRNGKSQIVAASGTAGSEWKCDLMDLILGIAVLCVVSFLREALLLEG